jgi:CTP:molybdopterin cytidylyltransferase MocA
VPLCGKPLLWHKINQIAEAGIQDIILCAGKNTPATRACVDQLSWDSSVSISYSPQGLFALSDLSSILKSLKGRGGDEHILITAGDCLTNTDYSRLVAEHAQGHKHLTIATRDSHGDRVFIQDAIASHSFLREASRNSHKHLSHYPYNSPLTAAIKATWHNHALLEVQITTDHVNINTICDYATLISDPGRFVRVSAIGQPRLSDLAPASQARQHFLQP